MKAGTTTREIASKWPSAKEAWGYAEEDQAAANLWGHGLGLAQYDPPVISRIWSLDHPIEIKAGMVFALETQHGKLFRWGVRIEEMLIVHEDQHRDHLELPGQADHRSRSDAGLRGSRQVSDASSSFRRIRQRSQVGPRVRLGPARRAVWSVERYGRFIVPLSSEEATDAGALRTQGGEPRGARARRTANPRRLLSRRRGLSASSHLARPRRRRLAVSSAPRTRIRHGSTRCA